VEGGAHGPDLRSHGHGLSLALKLAQAGLGFFDVLLGLIALGLDSGELLAQVTVVVAALLGFGFPLVSAMCDFGQLTHRVRSFTSPRGARAWGGPWTCSNSIERLAVQCTWRVNARQASPMPTHKERA